MSLIQSCRPGRQASRSPRAILPALDPAALKLLSRLGRGPVPIAMLADEAEHRSLDILSRRGAARLAIAADGGAVAVAGRRA